MRTLLHSKNHGSENSFKEDFMKNNMYQRGKMTMVK
jgi:hypothetical protein